MKGGGIKEKKKEEASVKQQKRMGDIFRSDDRGRHWRESKNGDGQDSRTGEMNINVTEQIRERAFLYPMYMSLNKD